MNKHRDHPIASSSAFNISVSGVTGFSYGQSGPLRIFYGKRRDGKIFAFAHNFALGNA